MGIVAAAQVREVLLLGNVGFGHHNATATDRLQQLAQDAHHRVGLRTMQACGALFFPDKPHGIEAEPAHPMTAQPAE